MPKKNIRFRFGERVRKLRRQKGRSQRVLAKQAGISRSYLQKIEGNNPPGVTVDTIAKIARGFEISASQLLKF